VAGKASCLVKNLNGEVLVWLSVWSEMQTTGPANATATPSSLLQKNSDWFILIPAYPGCPVKKTIK